MDLDLRVASCYMTVRVLAILRVVLILNVCKLLKSGADATPVYPFNGGVSGL
jgi:hypothetical protein